MRRLKEDDGASAVLLGMVIVMVLGFGAFAIDISAIYQEKRELQNGADGAALAAAQECADRLEAGSTACASSADGPLNAITDQYANANANDAASAAEILGQGAIEPAGSSPDLATNWGSQRLRVHTSTIADGNAFMTHYLAQILGRPTDEVHAYATAAWGNVGSLNGSIPLTFSQCEWDRFTNNGTNFASEPYDPAAQQVIQFHDGNATEPCHSFSSGLDIPGGFGWLTTDGVSCETVLDAGNWSNEDPGSSASNGCDAGDVAALLDTVVLLPIFDDTAGQGAGGQYHIWGFAAFHLSSYRLGGAPAWNAVLPGYSACGSGDERCVGGHFTGFVDVGATLDPDAPFTGLTTVQLIG